MQLFDDVYSVTMWKNAGKPQIYSQRWKLHFFSNATLKLVLRLAGRIDAPKLDSWRVFTNTRTLTIKECRWWSKTVTIVTFLAVREGNNEKERRRKEGTAHHSREVCQYCSWCNHQDAAHFPICWWRSDIYRLSTGRESLHRIIKKSELIRNHFLIKPTPMLPGGLLHLCW